MDNFPLRILIVDDSDVDRNITLRAFAKAEIKDELIVATSGKNCLDYVLNQGPYADVKKYPCPDIILLDINMPQLNGFDVLHELKKSPKSEHVLIIMFTNSTSSQDVSKSYRSGASTYIVKPFTFDELVETLKTFDAYWKKVGRLPKHLSGVET